MELTLGFVSKAGPESLVPSDSDSFSGASLATQKDPVPGMARRTRACRFLERKG